jgi:malonate transporter
MGVTAALRPLKRVPMDLSYLVPIKLVVHPLLVYLLVSRIPGVDTVWVHSAVLLAALSSATNVFVIAQQYQVWEERASSAVVISTVLSIVTVTSFIYLATNTLV